MSGANDYILDTVAVVTISQGDEPHELCDFLAGLDRNALEGVAAGLLGIFKATAKSLAVVVEQEPDEFVARLMQAMALEVSS